MRRKFESLQHPAEYGYVYDSEEWTSDAQVNCRFRMFQTYGDGQTQHSGDWPITTEYMADYLASLATVMLADDDLTNHVSHEIDCGPNVERIAFAASVVYKESDGDCNYSKRRYYSVSERKVLRSKEHDKRYEEIKDWNNGDPDSIYRMVIGEYSTGIKKYATAEAIRDWTQAQPKMYMPLAAEFLKWFAGDYDPRQKAQALRHAFGACLSIIRAYRLRCEAECHLRNMPKPAEEAVLPKLDADRQVGETEVEVQP